VAVIVVLRRMPSVWVVDRVVDAETRAATKPSTHSASKDIRSDWWFVMVAGSLSISFAYPPHHPAPSHCCSPILPHCRVIRTVTLYERGDDKRIYTQSLAGEYISFASRVFNLNA